MPETTYAEFQKEGGVINKSLAANAAELPHLEGHRVRFDAILVRVGDLLAQQADLTARKQEISKELAAIVLEGKQLLFFLRTGVKQHFGRRAEKLVAFGIQPFRGISRKKTGPVEPPEPPAPSPNQ